jgi:hypothetical protein
LSYSLLSSVLKYMSTQQEDLGALHSLSDMDCSLASQDSSHEPLHWSRTPETMLSLPVKVRRTMIRTTRDRTATMMAWNEIPEARLSILNFSRKCYIKLFLIIIRIGEYVCATDGFQEFTIRGGAGLFIAFTVLLTGPWAGRGLLLYSRWVHE